MGYRSQVVFVVKYYNEDLDIDHEDKEKLKELINSSDKNNRSLAIELFKGFDDDISTTHIELIDVLYNSDCFDADVNTEYVIFNGGYLKWYDGYPLVDKCSNLMHGIDDEMFAFVRLGEEFGEHETSGSLCEFDITLHQSIDF